MSPREATAALPSTAMPMLLAALITSAAAYAYPLAARAHVRRGCVAMHADTVPRLRLLDSYTNTMEMLLLATVRATEVHLPMVMSI